LHGDYISRVTIGQLATHTSGLVMPAEPEPVSPRGYPLAQFLGVLNNYTPEDGEQQGKQLIYSHAGYVLLQLALERRYGRPIDELIRDRITGPLGMDSTLVPERGPHDRAIMPREFMQRAVQGYSYDGSTIGLPGNQQGDFDFPGTGQMFSSPRDLAILAAASVHDAPVEGEMWKALKATEQGVFRVSADDVQAMAWEVIDDGGLTIVDKPGGLNNAQAYIGLVPAQKLGLVILSNRGDIHPFEPARTTILPDWRASNNELFEPRAGSVHNCPAACALATFGSRSP
jgi:beta-lactamase class C